jgi:hypothetical protein
MFTYSKDIEHILYAYQARKDLSAAYSRFVLILLGQHARSLTAAVAYMATK